MRQVVTLYAMTPGTSDGMGGTTGASESVVATTRAAVEPVTSRERDQAMSVQTERTHRVNLRYRPGITETMTVGLGSRRFRIVGIRDLDERHRELELVCVEIGSDGVAV
jgi:SPP1 family predicted phage head-tail adaptor